MLKVKSNFSRLNQTSASQPWPQHSFLSKAAEFLSGHESFPRGLLLWPGYTSACGAGLVLSWGTLPLPPTLWASPSSHAKNCSARPWSRQCVGLCDGQTRTEQAGEARAQHREGMAWHKPLPNLVPGNCSRSRSCGRQVGTPPWCQPLLIKPGRTADLLPLEHAVHSHSSSGNPRNLRLCPE